MKIWKCQNCKKGNVPETGFKMFIHYRIITMFEVDKEKIPIFGEACKQVRLCKECLKKKTLEFSLDD